MVTVPVPARADVQNLRSVGVPGKPLGQPPIQECVARYSSSDANHLKVPSSGSSPCPHCDPSWGKNWVCSHGFPALLLSLWSHIQFVVERKTRQRLHWSHRAVQWQTSADNRDRHQQVSLNVVCMDWGSFLIQQENKYRVKPLWETEMLVVNDSKQLAICWDSRVLYWGWVCTPWPRGRRVKSTQQWLWLMLRKSLLWDWVDRADIY